MSIRYHTINHLEWRDLDTCACVKPRLLKILQSWEGTPYMDGQRLRGVATNCIGFASGVLDELYGSESSFPRLPPDTAMHNRREAMRIMRTMMRAFQHEQAIDYVEPGDVLVTGELGGGPGHIIVVGERQLWQSTRFFGVRPTGLGLIQTHQVFHAAFRMLNKESWCECELAE